MEGPVADTGSAGRSRPFTGIVEPIREQRAHNGDPHRGPTRGSLYGLCLAATLVVLPCCGRVDDADGGRRGLRPALSSARVAAVTAAYGVSIAPATDLGGFVSLNLLTDDGRRRVVVRVHRSSVTTARVAAVQRIRVLLAHAGVPSPTRIEARTGAPFIEVDGHVVEMESFVVSDATMNSPHSVLEPHLR